MSVFFIFYFYHRNFNPCAGLHGGYVLARRGTKIAIIIFNLKYDFRVMRFGLSAQRRQPTHTQTTPKNVRATRRIKNISVSKVSGVQIMRTPKLARVRV